MEGEDRRKGEDRRGIGGEAEGRGGSGDGEAEGRGGEGLL